MICIYKSCDKEVLARSLCRKHYSHWRNGKLGTTKERERHGLEGTPEYEIWKSMKQRCLNPNNKDYKNYGGRGISVHSTWINSFSNFINDMGHRPSPELTLDRINNDGNYEPSNCRWTTRVDQANNQRYTTRTKSGERNISWHVSSNKWRVRIQHNNVQEYIGSFDTMDEAVVARNRFIKRSY